MTKLQDNIFEEIIPVECWNHRYIQSIIDEHGSYYSYQFKFKDKQNINYLGLELMVCNLIPEDFQTVTKHNKDLKIKLKDLLEEELNKRFVCEKIKSNFTKGVVKCTYRIQTFPELDRIRKVYQQNKKHFIEALHCLRAHLSEHGINIDEQFKLLGESD